MPIPSVLQQVSKNNNRSKLKLSVCLGVLIALAIILWNIYEHLFHEKAVDEPTSEHEMSELTQLLFADEIVHNTYLKDVNFQGQTKSSGRDDRAPHPLLHVDNDAATMDKLSTIYLMKLLFDNYELDTFTNEMVTAEKEQEELNFLDAILDTSVMKKTMIFLQAKGHVTLDLGKQRALLKDIWFTRYSRGHGRIGSSGFEHVFMAELKNNTVLGLHNWIYFNEQEQLGHLDYRGFIERVDFEKENHYLAVIRFSFHNKVKSYNSLFIGTSPELEMSLYTVCFLMSPGKLCPVAFGRHKFSITTYPWNYEGKRSLATAYPSTDKV